MTAISAAERARLAQPRIGRATADERNRALEMIARVLEEGVAGILEANQADVAEACHLPPPMVARLRLDAHKLSAVIAGVRAVAALPDVLGEILAAWDRPNGLRIRRVRVPLGVVGIIYEARPGVTVEAKGGREAARSNAALGGAIATGLRRVGLPVDLAAVLPSTREAGAELMRATGLVDVLIPRGGAGLIKAVVAESRVPVIETGTGVCHVYVHEGADPAMAEAIILNAKGQNPAVCNAAETMLVDRSVAASTLPRLGAALRSAGVTLRGCPETCAILPWAEPAAEEDWAAEYLDLTLAVRVVGGLDGALAHIARYGTRHSEAIVTADGKAAARFLAEVDAAAVYHNASTRFTDGGEFGFGAEIGISTQRLHARGPMGLAELTSYKYIIEGRGQTRA